MRKIKSLLFVLLVFVPLISYGQFVGIGGYLFDFRHDRKNAITVTPNLYFDYKFFFVKAGYDFDVSHGRSQYFVRAGVCIGMGSLKMFGNTKIW